MDKGSTIFPLTTKGISNQSPGLSVMNMYRGPSSEKKTNSRGLNGKQLAFAHITEEFRGMAHLQGACIPRH